MDTMLVRKPQLREALKRWIDDIVTTLAPYGLGPANALPLEQVADESTEYLWAVLREIGLFK